jgi:pSer/pThr/pTyr-binding forkhead associated (FHA) protein
MARLLELRGERGLFADVRMQLMEGERVVIGRSRFLELSAASTPMARRIGRGRLESNAAYRRMSRRHFEVEYEAADAVVVRDLSTNGVAVNGKRVDVTVRLNPAELAERPAVLRFGAGEELLLSAI